MKDQTTAAIYSFIVKYMDKHNGLAPSQREIAEACFLVRSAVLRHLDRLEAWGYIIREPGKARSIRLPATHIESI